MIYHGFRRFYITEELAAILAEFLILINPMPTPVYARVMTIPTRMPVIGRKSDWALSDLGMERDGRIAKIKIPIVPKSATNAKRK